ncbi:hypothetical protein ACWA7J_17085 [Leptothrix sp. BB-4]
MNRPTKAVVNPPAALPPAPLAPPPEDRFCDLVLTGGVTSGVVYPPAVCEIARHYRFHSLGGTSVGAIAAAIAASAEYQRRLGSDAGFDVLRRVPETLAEPIAVTGRASEVTHGIETWPTRLLSLFQPGTDAGVRLLRLFLAANPTGQPDIGFWKRLWLAFLESTRVYRSAYAVALLLALAAVLATWGGGGGWVQPWSPRQFVHVLLMLVAVVVAALLLVGLRLYSDLDAGLLKRHLGLCTGLGQPGSGKGLTDWLHDSIQWAAGRHSHETPMTFHDLAEAPEGGLPPQADPAAPRRRSIDLRMVTTCLTHGRPCELPLADTEENAALFFAREEWVDFFPKPVMDLLDDICKPYPDTLADGEWMTSRGLPPGRPLTLLQMPRERMPLLVASRLSLSFPGIFATVPAWSLDREESCWRRVRFSDGGICANFPIHLFDAAVPRWPTFGILLDLPDNGSRPPPHAHSVRVEGAKYRGHVWLPRDPGEGAASLSRDLPEKGVLRAVFAFLALVLDAARLWHDHGLTRMAGVRDRVVRITLAKGEGELDLRVTGQEITGLGERYGKTAAALLLGRFLPQADGRPSPAWNEHRWMRWNLTATNLRTRIAGIGAAAESAAGCEALSCQIEAARDERPMRGVDHTLDPEQGDALAGLLGSLVAVERQLALQWREQPWQPEPEPPR